MNQIVKTPAADAAFATGAFTRETVMFHSPGKEVRP